MSRVTTLLFFVLLQSLVALRVEAGPPAPALSWVREPGAEGCIASVDLAKKVETMLGRAVFVSAAEAELVVEGYVRSHVLSEGDQEFRAVLMVSDVSGRILGSRELQTAGPDCTELDEALALVIAVTLYPDSGLAGEPLLPQKLNAALDTLFPEAPEGPDLGTLVSETSAEHGTSGNKEPKGKPETTPKGGTVESAPARKPEQEADPTLSAVEPLTGAAPTAVTHMQVGAGGVAGVGLLPGLTPGVRASVLFAPGDIWPIGLSGTLWMPAEADAKRGVSAKAKASFRLFSAGPCVCPLSRFSSWFAGVACLGVQVGALTGDTEGFRENSNTAKAVVNLDIETQVATMLFDPVWSRVGITATLPLVQHTFKYQDWTGRPYDLFQMAQLGLSAGLGLELRL